MSRLLIVATLLLILSGCVTQKRCNKKYPPSESTRIDSIYIEREIVKWKDTIIYQQLPPIVVERYVSINDTLKLTGSYSEAFAWVSDGNILGKLNEGYGINATSVTPTTLTLRNVVFDNLKQNYNIDANITIVTE